MITRRNILKGFALTPLAAVIPLASFGKGEDSPTVGGLSELMNASRLREDDLNRLLGPMAERIAKDLEDDFMKHMLNQA